MMNWIMSNKALLLSWLYFTLSMLSGSLPYPKTPGFLSMLRKLLDMVANHAPRDAPGSVKLPFIPSKDPGKANLPALTLLVGLIVIGVAGVARADVPTWSQGPSLNAMRFGFQRDPASPSTDKPSFSMLSAGAGWTLHYNPRATLSSNRQICYLSVDGTALANLSTLPTAGGLSLAGGVSTYNGLFGLQAGYKLFEIADGNPTEGLFTLSGGRRNVFFLVSVSFNLLFGPLTTSVPLRGMMAPPAPTPPNFFHL